MQIRIDPHTLERAEERGTHEAEIQDVPRTGSPISGKYGRMGKGKVYAFQEKRHGKYYEQKRLEIFYTVEENTIVTVTVYVFYGEWEREDANSV